jgi:hypothetical protein
VAIDSVLVQRNHYKVVVSDVVDAAAPMRHDSKKLGQSIMRIYYDGTQAANDKSKARPKPVEPAESVPV